MTEKKELHLPDHIKEKMFMVRNKAWYEEEYADCKSIRGRFHQYFVHGYLLDCSPWKRDADNCERWTKNQDRDSLEELIDSETKRREERLKPFTENEVWEPRTSPPGNWNSPLPEWMVEEYKTSYLGIKASEFKDLIADKGTSLCNIM
ncbi:hypothetical protein LSTR_LSTR001416 [Laodelphax striatellus]|uniref:Synaptic plasticity regulator PANTS n=1 Tax=Laodelphax striatellus TaxID=195883 RepID=A0A482XBE1_LAOST|nr:hypothetical protein LSTR_LSTR001416 [Laodelphax striatellus]